MSAIATAIVGSAVVGGAVSSRASRKASRAQQQSADQAAQLQKEMFDRQVELNEPFRQAGITGQNELLRMLGLGGDAASAGYGSLGRNYTMADLEMDPGYGFRLSEGMKALDRTAAARGGMMSGAALKAAGRFGQDMASQEYLNAFNRAQALKSERLGVLGSLYGAGQTAAQQVSNAAGQYGVNAGNMMMQSGQARASGYIGSANAITNALGQAALGYGMFGGGGRGHQLSSSTLDAMLPGVTVTGRRVS
jgi:hypothetical protein